MKLQRVAGSVDGGSWSTGLRSRASVAAVCVLLAFPATAYDAPGMRDAMREVFASMRVLLELSANPQNLRDPANEDTILAATTELADQAALVSAHAPRDELSFLAGSLDRYANWIRRSYEWRQFDSMTRLVHDAVDLCVACHTRLPSPGDSPLAEDFLAHDDLGTLTAIDRARLQVATRRFGDALQTLEAALPGEVAAADFFDTVRTYLVVAVRVKGDPARAASTLESLTGIAVLDPQRRAPLAAMVEALRGLVARPPAPGDLSAARETVREAEAAGGADGPSQMVRYVEATRLLYEFLETGRGTVNEGAEAYYLLGLTRYRLEREAWLPQAELYLEKAIRTAPGSEHSRRAFALLETQIEQRLGGSGGKLPEDVVRHLDMLRELVRDPA